jgi:hypothetical protein
MATRGRIHSINLVLRLVLPLLLAVSLSPAEAATRHARTPKTEQVVIRASDHAALTRVLITWPHTPEYQFAQAGDVVTITFARAGKADLGETAKLHLRDVASIEALTDTGKLIVEVKVKPGAKATAFKLGENVLVDAADPTPEAAAAAATPATTPQDAAAESQDKPAAASSGTNLHLALAPAARLAVFRRGDNLWLATDVTLANPPAFPDKLGPPTAVLATGGSIYRYHLKDPAGIVTAHQVKDGWDVGFGAEPDTTPGLSVKPEGDLNRLKISVANPGKVITATDPDLGDVLQIVPVGGPARVERSHSYPDIGLLASAQGVAFVRKGDGASVETDAARIIVNKVAALDLVAGNEDAPLFFDFATWRQGGPTRLWAYRAATQLQAATEPKPTQAAKDMLDLARAYTANGLGAEALGYLTYAQSLQDDLASSPDFLALRGAAAALADRPEIALPALNNSQLQTQAELRLWRGFAEADGTAEQQDDATTLMRGSSMIIEKYPPELQNRAALKLAELALRSDDLPTLQETANLLQRLPQTDDIQTAKAVLKATLLAKSPTPEQAIAAYDDAAKTTDPYWKAVASLLAVKTGLRDQTISATDAIRRLESLRYMWRGDDRERQTLLTLGGLYLDQGNFTQGLPILRQLMDIAPDTPVAAQAKDKIIAAVKQSFSADHSRDYSPLDVLTFYDTASDILPPDTLTSADFARLSQRLAEIGLMDRAADFLMPQLKTAQDAPRAELGARIAALRLLDDHPDAALKVLADTSSDKANDALKNERKLLQARAMSKTGQPFEALVLLQGVNSREADALRVDIAWGVQNWKEAAAALGRLAGPVLNGKLTDEQSNIVLNEAVAMSLGGDTAGLAQLNQDYGGPMLSTPRGNAFALLTSPSGDVRAPNVDAVKATVSGLDIFQNFLAGYHKAG